VLRTIALVSAGVLLAGAAFELVLALGAGSVGGQPVDSSTGQSIVGPIVFFVWLVGLVVAVIGIWRSNRAVALLAPAMGLFVTAVDYTFDPYYAPTERRFADGGAVPVGWIFTLLVISLAVGAFTRRWPRPGSGLTAFTLFVWFVTLIAAGDGH
jgi:hypothetical protein